MNFNKEEIVREFVEKGLDFGGKADVGTKSTEKSRTLRGAESVSPDMVN